MNVSGRLFSLLGWIFIGPLTAVNATDPGEALDAHLKANPGGKAAFSFDRRDYQGELSSLPIGVFDSGVGGLTVLEAILTLDVFHNETLKPGPDGRPDFENERFLYLGDQANMPYGKYAKVGKVDYLRELILKDAVFLLGRRYHRGDAIVYDKPPVKAIVIACNTATAYGLEDIEAALKRWEIPVMVVGVVEAGARGLLETVDEGAGAIGVMATVGTCASEVYPRTIRRTLGRAGRDLVTVTQFGSTDLAAMIEGDPAQKGNTSEQIAVDVKALVEAHRTAGKGKPIEPLSTIMLGCTHFPLVREEIVAAFTTLRENRDYTALLAEKLTFIDPAEWTARQLFRELASAHLRRRGGAGEEDVNRFFLSVPHLTGSDAGLKRDDAGGLSYDYKYGREPGQFQEDTIIVPMTRTILPESGRKLVSEKLPMVWAGLGE